MFLTGSAAAVRDVTRRYGVFFRKNEDGSVDHTQLTSLIDAEGEIRVQYLGARFDPEEFRHDLMSLVGRGMRSRSTPCWSARLRACRARVQTKLLTAFLAIVALLIALGAVGLFVLSGVNRRTEELIASERKIAAYRQVQHDTTSQLYSVSSALLASDERSHGQRAAPAQPVRL